MTSTTWNVWSQDSANQAWLCVVENVSYTEAEEAVERKMATAEKYGIAATFLALPKGTRP